MIKFMNARLITHLTIHCAATPEGRDNSAAEVRAWDIARFGQPSYHHVIELDGDIVRHLDDNQLGAHTGGHNTGNIGVCYVGGTTTMATGGKPKDTRTGPQRVTLRKIVAEYRIIYPNLIVFGHRDWPGVAKACPCFDVRTAL